MLELYKNIKNERIKKGWNQTELAKRVGYSDKSMIAKIEAGKVDLPQTKIRTFAEVFNCTESQLMGWNDSEAIDTSESLTMSDEELHILETYRNLNNDLKHQANVYFAFLNDQNNKQ